MTNTIDSLKIDNAAYWAKRAPSYSEVNQDELRGDQKTVWLGELQSQIARAYPQVDPADLNVLDIGCGPGFFSIILARAGYCVTAVNYTPDMLEQARSNAGDVADSIVFRQMDAQNLKFDDDAFDVIVTRNLTWNLPDPAAAYSEWVRVLKPGGILLNYDANWYNQPFDAELRDAYLKDRDATQSLGIKDEYAGTDIHAMEEIARQLPLSPVTRPAWDLNMLAKLDLSSVEVDEEAWQRVFSDEERVNYASTPMFCVRVRK